MNRMPTSSYSGSPQQPSPEDTEINPSCSTHILATKTGSDKPIYWQHFMSASISKAQRKNTDLAAQQIAELG